MRRQTEGTLEKSVEDKPLGANKEAVVPDIYSSYHGNMNQTPTATDLNTRRLVTGAITIAVVLSFVGVTSGLLAMGQGWGAALGLGAFVGFWGGLGFGAMIGGVIWATRMENS